MVDRKRKKSKRKTKKRLSREMIKIVVNNYLNNRGLRKERRRQAQQKRNPMNRIGSQYPIQNRAIDSYSYLNAFRHTNDTRLMALERGMSNTLTANIALLNDVIRQNRNIPLLDNKPHFNPPSQDYKSFNPNYPDEDTQSTISGYSLDADELENLKKDYELEEKKEEEKKEELTTIPEEEQEDKRGGGKGSKKGSIADFFKKSPEEEIDKAVKTKKKITIKKAEPAKDYGKRPTQKEIFSYATDDKIIADAVRYDFPESEMNKYVFVNVAGEKRIKPGQVVNFKKAILNRARELTQKPTKGRKIKGN